MSDGRRSGASSDRVARPAQWRSTEKASVASHTVPALATSPQNADELRAAAFRRAAAEGGAQLRLRHPSTAHQEDVVRRHRVANPSYYGSDGQRPPLSPISRRHAQAAAAANEVIATKGSSVILLCLACFVIALLAVYSALDEADMLPDWMPPLHELNNAQRNARDEQRGAKMRDSQFRMSVSLEDVYNGETLSVTWPESKGRQELCSHCRGTGSEFGSRDVYKCPKCAGRGFTLHNFQPMPGFVQKVKQQCHTCGGSGEHIAHKCKVCGGSKTIFNREAQFQVDIPRGAEEGHRLLIAGKGHSSPHVRSGNVLLEIYSEKHRVFERRGHDLHVGLKLSLAEALLGFNHTISHLDSSAIVIDRTTEVTGPMTVLRLRGKGMPMYTNTGPVSYGDMVVEFDVRFPRKLTRDQQQKLKSLLRA